MADTWNPLDLSAALEAVYTASLDGVMITGPDQCIVMVNDTYVRMTGYAREELVGRRPNVVASGLTPRQTYQEMWRDLRERGKWTGEVINRRRNGHLWHSYLSITRVEREGRLLGYIGIARDVTRQKQALLTFQRLALLDELTGLFNRRYLNRQLARESAAARRQGAPLALLMIDIDDFKALNDRFGHEAGDGVLCRVAATLAANLRVEDVLCRFGGEEFAALLPRTGLAEALAVAERLRQAVAEVTHDLPPGTPGVTVSIGACAAEAGTGPRESLVSVADRALYRAKQAGKNRVSACGEAVAPAAGRGGGPAAASIHPAVPCLREASASFWRAEERWGVGAVLQPIVDLRSGAAVGFEALARGRRGSAVEGADALFQAAQRSGYRCALSGLATEVAVRTRLGPGQTLFVNVDPTLTTCPFVATCPVYRWLGQDEAGRGRLVLEISERSHIRDRAAIEDFVRRSRDQGHRFALDDVGTAYAGLQTLLWLNPEYVKIDRSLICGIDRDRPRAALVRSLVSYTRLTGAKTVAEGVETEEELRTVVRLGVHLGQGFFLHPPAAEPRDPAPEALAVIGANGSRARASSGGRPS